MLLFLFFFVLFYSNFSPSFSLYHSIVFIFFPISLPFFFVSLCFFYYYYYYSLSHFSPSFSLGLFIFFSARFSFSRYLFFLFLVLSLFFYFIFSFCSSLSLEKIKFSHWSACVDGRKITTHRLPLAAYVDSPLVS